MEQSHRHEKVTNGKLAELIEKVMHGRRTQAERTRILAGKDNAGKFPDIPITATGRSPVVIEAKWMDVSEHLVEEQARKHVGQRIDGQPHKIEAAIALRYPNRIATVDDIDEELKKTKDLKYCAVYPKGKRFPTTGWLTGSVIDLADLIHLVDVPETAFQKCAEDLEKNIGLAGNQIPVPKKLNEGEIHEIFQRLGLTEDPKAKEASQFERRKKKRDQTARIAGAILVNALLFQERIAGHADYQGQGIPFIHDIGGKSAENRKSKALAAWKKILAINYWPIFDAAIQIISILSAPQASEVLRILTAAAESVQEKGLLYENDLTGHVFQNLIVDRKYLAAFYTLPTSAALLARLAVSKMKDIDWSDADKIGELKIADFACGTGALSIYFFFAFL